MFASGERSESCQKLKIIIGRVNESAPRVRIKASFIEKASGKK